jgi:hypothetical protein
VIRHRIMSNGSVSGIRTIAFIIFPSSQRNLHCHSYLQLVPCLFVLLASGAGGSAPNSDLKDK